MVWLVIGLCRGRMPSRNAGKLRIHAYCRSSRRQLTKGGLQTDGWEVRLTSHHESNHHVKKCYRGPRTWAGLLNTVMNLRVPWKAENLLSTWATINLSRTLLHGVDCMLHPLVLPWARIQSHVISLLHIGHMQNTVVFWRFRIRIMDTAKPLFLAVSK
jgi:hypothetical protein